MDYGYYSYIIITFAGTHFMQSSNAFTGTTTNLLVRNLRNNLILS